MKVFVLLSFVTRLLLSSSDCSPKKAGSDKYKGKLEIAGICMNYTIRVVEGNVDASLLDANWTDETTKQSYTNVFKLGNPCQFPSTIKQGDEFYFTIDSSQAKPCTVCMAYYPTPSKAVSIKVFAN
jgi:hypothetical protein